MSQNGLSKVENIVDEIVKNNTMFNLKSIIEQEKEKDSIVKSMNSVLSPLNVIGRELVLQDLSVDPDEKFKGFIDSAGNVDIPGLVRITNNVMEEKIELAEREGINLLSNNQPIINKEIAESALALTTIAVMVEKYEELSIEEIESLLNRWDDLTEEQQQAIFEETDEEIKNIGELSTYISNKQHKKEFEELIKKYNENTDALLMYEKLSKLKSEGKLSEEGNKALEELAKVLGLEEGGQDKSKISSVRKKQVEAGLEIKRYFITMIRQGEIDISKLSEDKLVEIKEFVKNNPQDVRKILNKLREDEQDVKSDKNEEKPAEERRELSGNVKSEYEYNEAELSESDKQNLPKRVVFSKISKEFMDDTKEKTTEESSIEDDFKKGTQSFVGALKRANFSDTEIKTALQAYSGFFKGLSEDDIEYLTEEQPEDFINIVAQQFEEIEIDESSKKILRMMANVPSAGKMQSILRNPQQTQQLLQYIDQLVEKGIEKIEEIKSDDEFAEIFSQYFDTHVEELNASAINELNREIKNSPEVEDQTDSSGDGDATAGNTSTGYFKPEQFNDIFKNMGTRWIDVTSQEKTVVDKNREETREGEEQAPEPEEYTTE